MSYYRNNAKKRANRAAWIDGYRAARSSDFRGYVPPEMRNVLAAWRAGVRAGRQARGEK